MGGGGGDSDDRAVGSVNRSASPSEQFPSSDPHHGGRLKPRDDHTWATILDELHRAIDDTSKEAGPSAPPATSSRTTTCTAHLAPPDGAPRGRKRLRSRGRSWSVGAAPSAFEGPIDSDVPMRLEPADLPPASAPTIRHYGHGHSHLFHLHISSAHPPEPPPPHTVTPRHSSPALLASPIQLMSGSARRGSSSPSPVLPISSSVPRDFEPQPMSCDPRRRASLTNTNIPGRPTSAPTLLSPSPGSTSGGPLFPSLPASPESPSSWLRSPTGPRRFRSDDSSVSDTIMFTPRQLDFEHDMDTRFATLGRRLVWNAFEMDDTDGEGGSEGRTRAEGSRLQGIGLGPAFSPPAVCTRDEPASPAFALETEPGVGTS